MKNLNQEETALTKNELYFRFEDLPLPTHFT